MPNTVSLGLPLLVAEQAQKHVTHNEALRALDALAQLAVKDRDLAAPPGSPAEGDRYIVAASPTGIWAGHAADVAVWQDGAWDFHTPREGWRCWVEDENVFLIFNGSAWVDWGAALGALQNLALLGIGTTTDATNPFSAKLNKALWTAKTAAEGGDGDLRSTMNKETASDVLSLLLQTGFSGRAEIGLIGDDNLSFKVSADGSTWNIGLVADKTTGGVRFLANEADVASASTCDVGAAAGLKVRITGTTTITSLGSVANAIKAVRFAGALTLTHNATSLILPNGGSNITTAAGDAMLAASDSSGNWRVLLYQKANGAALSGSATPNLSDIVASGALALVDWTDIASAVTTDLGSIASNFVRVTGTTTITGLGTVAATAWRFVRFAGALTLTHNAASLILPGAANIATVAGDCGLFKSEGSGNWRCLWLAKASGKALIGPASTDISDSTTTGRSVLTAANAAAVRTAAGVVIGTDVEAHDADLTTIAGLSPSNDDVLQRKAGAWTNRTIAQLLSDLGIAANYQPLDSDLTSIAALSTTSFGRGLLASTSAAALATSAGVGTGDSPTMTALTLSNGQIVFPASQVASAGANTLDDYEEGTFTPTLTSSGGGTPTYSQQTGFYTKVGNRVCYEARVVLSNLSTLAAGSANLAGLPFAAESSANRIAAQAFNANNMGATAATMTNANINNGNSTVNLNVFAAGANSNLTVAMLTNTSVFNVAGTYGA